MRPSPRRTAATPAGSTPSVCSGPSPACSRWHWARRRSCVPAGALPRPRLSRPPRSSRPSAPSRSRRSGGPADTGIVRLVSYSTIPSDIRVLLGGCCWVQTVVVVVLIALLRGVIRRRGEGRHDDLVEGGREGAQRTRQQRACSTAA